MSDGVDIDAVHYTALNRGRPPKPMRELILAKLARGKGLSRSDVRDVFGHNTGRREESMAHLDAMVAAGEVFRFEVPARGFPCERFFLDQRAGEKWRAEHAAKRDAPPKKKMVKPKQRLMSVVEQTDGKAWRNLTQRPVPGPAVTPQGVKHTVLPSAPVYSRHQVLPGEAVPSVISGAECRPWARQCIGGGA